MRFPTISRGHGRRLTVLAAAGVLALGLAACSSDDAEDATAGTPFTQALAKDLAKAGPLVNLASGEFFKALDAEALPGSILTPVFEDLQKGTYKVVSFHAKRARGLMARFAIRERLQDPEGLKAFGEEGYAFDKAASDEHRWVFRR